jgi:hypothetical protein
MSPQIQVKIVECKYRGPWIICRGALMGQTCWHPDNVDTTGRPHLFSKSCEEWGDDCPILRKPPQKAAN